MEKGQICQITIEDISNEGQGIGRAEGMAVFVQGVVLGDLAEVELVKVKKSYAFGRLLEIKEPSPHRTEPFCCHAGQCGGCNFQEMRYESQLTLKEKQVRDRLQRLAGLDNPKINPIISMEIPYRYRNKAQFPISCGGIITRKGGIIENLGECSIGFYRAKSHEIINCEECAIQAPPAAAAAKALREFMTQDNITAYDPKWEKGLMRHLIVKTAFGTGEVMVILVINGRGIPNADKLVKKLDDAIYQLPPAEDGTVYTLESVVLNVNKKKTGEILGEQCMAIAGRPTILERAAGLEFEISPLAFYQVNPVQMEKLTQKVLEYADLQGHETILDLYCGVGTIGLCCAREMERKAAGNGLQAKSNAETGQVIGIESVKGAVLDANRNAVINGIVNARYVCGKAEHEIKQVLAGGIDKDGFSIPSVNPDIVILDPPRAGCAPELLAAVKKAAPEKIIYVSCDPATLARDIKILCSEEQGETYKFVEAAPVDMFPWTGHVETVCLMSRVK